jgi:hypothetical protein
MLFVFLLNALGYYGILMGLKRKHTQTLLAKFDEDDYARQHEVIIQVPITIPYATDSKEFTRVDGEFEYKGEVYRIVKQRLQSDTLHIVCVKDFTAKALKQSLADYVKSYTDKPSSEQSQTKVLQNLIKDFMAAFATLQTINTGWNYEVHLSSISNVFQSITIPIASPPPQA